MLLAVDVHQHVGWKLLLDCGESLPVKHKVALSLQLGDDSSCIRRSQEAEHESCAAQRLDALSNPSVMQAGGCGTLRLAVETTFPSWLAAVGTAYQLADIWPIATCPGIPASQETRS